MYSVSLTLSTRQYQELHKEQLRLLNEVHRASSQGFKARSRLVTKENERRRRYSNIKYNLAPLNIYLLLVYT